jgi:hypothetical protein
MSALTSLALLSLSTFFSSSYSSKKISLCHLGQYIVVTEEDIASSFEEFQFNDLFFFFGLLWLTVQDILASPPPLPSSQALSHQNLPGKR